MTLGSSCCTQKVLNDCVSLKKVGMQGTFIKVSVSDG